LRDWRAVFHPLTIDLLLFSSYSAVSNGNVPNLDELPAPFLEPSLALEVFEFPLRSVDIEYINILPPAHPHSLSTLAVVAQSIIREGFKRIGKALASCDQVLSGLYDLSTSPSSRFSH